jgi:invasion protein IalB
MEAHRETCQTGSEPFNIDVPDNENEMRQKHSPLFILLAAMAALGGTGALAQDTQTSPPKPTTLSETYDAWTVQCATTGQGAEQRRQCQMSQELQQQESRQRVLLVAIAKGEGNAKATLVLPFGILLSEGIRIEIGQQEFARGSFRTCYPAGCIVEIDLPEEAIKELQSGETASVLMTAVNNQPVKTDVSLKGFADAYRRLLELAAG